MKRCPECKSEVLLYDHKMSCSRGAVDFEKKKIADNKCNLLYAANQNDWEQVEIMLSRIKNSLDRIAYLEDNDV